MLIEKVNPTGIDAAIQSMQDWLHSSLLAKWNITSDQYRCYGRAYRNKKDNGYVAEVYEGEKEYKEVYWNDTLSALSFFGISSKAINQGMNTAEIHLVFFVDLEKLALKDAANSLIIHRADEECRRDVFNTIGMYFEGMTYISTELWLENVLKEYPGSRREERLKTVDMHPVHCFRLNYSLVYEDSYCLNKPLNSF